jgi:hypothetical protein
MTLNQRVPRPACPSTYNEKLFCKWLRDTFEPYVTGIIKAGETSLIVMDAASFHKTEGILTFIRTFETPMTTALIPPGLTSLVQPLDTAVNGHFKQFLQEEADTYVCELSDTGKLPNPGTLRDRREKATVIMGRAWERLQADPALVERAFLHCGISIHPDGHEDYLINIKAVDNSSINPNGWRSSSEYRSYEVISEDFDYIAALILATEELKPSIKTVTLKQL